MTEIVFGIIMFHVGSWFHHKGWDWLYKCKKCEI